MTPPTVTRWLPIRHYPRRLWVACSRFRYSALNESNQLTRAGWQESTATPRVYRCGECAEADR